MLRPKLATQNSGTNDCNTVYCKSIVLVVQRLTPMLMLTGTGICMKIVKRWRKQQQQPINTARKRHEQQDVYQVKSDNNNNCSVKSMITNANSWIAAESLHTLRSSDSAMCRVASMHCRKVDKLPQPQHHKHENVSRKVHILNPTKDDWFPIVGEMCIVMIIFCTRSS